MLLDLLGNRPASRLAGLVYIYELYKSEPITLSPFAAVFVRALMPTTKSAEKSFITLLLTNSPLAKEAYRYHTVEVFVYFDLHMHLGLVIVATVEITREWGGGQQESKMKKYFLIVANFYAKATRKLNF